MDGLFWRMEDLAGWLTALIVLGLILEYKGWGEKRLRHGGLVLAGLACVALMGTFACTILPEADFFHTVCSQKGTSDKLVALTFDDGPDAVFTPQVLQILHEYGVTATFFLLGQNVERYPELAACLAQEGHQLGNHTFRHSDLLKSSREELAEELDHTNQAIFAAAGVKPTVFRPPHGFRDAAVLHAVNQRGMRIIDWSVMSWDWERINAETIARRTLEQVKPGAIILLHDGEGLSSKADRSQTIAALRRIIPELQAQGYHFVTVETLLARSGEAR